MLLHLMHKHTVPLQSCIEYLLANHNTKDLHALARSNLVMSSQESNLAEFPCCYKTNFRAICWELHLFIYLISRWCFVG